MLFGHKILVRLHQRRKKGNKWLGTEHQCLCERGQNRCDLYACKNDYQWLGLSLANIVLMVNFLKLSNTEINKKKAMPCRQHIMYTEVRFCMMAEYSLNMCTQKTDCD